MAISDWKRSNVNQTVKMTRVNMEENSIEVRDLTRWERIRFLLSKYDYLIPMFVLLMIIAALRHYLG